MSAAPTLSTNTEYARTEQFCDSPSIDLKDISKVYRIPEIIDLININNFKKVCLQFPDHLVRDSSYVVIELQQSVDAAIYVLADTTYSPCCVDEVAMEHVQGDAVFHFGNACFYPCKTPHVYYVQPLNIKFDINKVIPHLQPPSSSADGGSGAPTLLYPDSSFTDGALQIANAMGSNPVNIAFPAPKLGEVVPPLPTLDGFYTDEIPNRIITGPKTNFEKLVYLSDNPSESLLLHWSTVFSEIIVINQFGELQSASPAIRRRYRYVQNIKAAGTVGILMNTLSLTDSVRLLERVKKAVTNAGKKYYTFVVGKPNIAKLGNFEVVDIWVVLGCPQGGVIVDCDDYVKPIVTPYELELALNDEWTGKWVLDMDKVLLNETNQSLVNEEEPLFDLVSGKFVFGNQPLRENQAILDSGNLELIKQTNALKIRNTVSTAAEKLQKKSWTGLGSDHEKNDEKFAELKLGRSGIARNYSIVTDDNQ